MPSDDGSCRILDLLVSKAFLYTDEVKWLVTMPWNALKLALAEISLTSSRRPRPMIFLDACLNADRTIALESYDIRVVRPMGCPACLYEMRRRWTALREEAFKIVMTRKWRLLNWTVE